MSGFDPTSGPRGAFITYSLANRGESAVVVRKISGTRGRKTFLKNRPKCNERELTTSARRAVPLLAALTGIGSALFVPRCLLIYRAYSAYTRATPR